MDRYLWVNSSRIHLDRFVAQVASTIPPGGRVLDAGAGHTPYRHHFAHLRYEAADFCQVDKRYAPMEHVCDLSEIPVEDEQYDGVLLTQVLEHLPEPELVLRELGRVLKPGGALWLTAPLYFPEHEQPFDFRRFTQFGFRHELSKAGFEVRRLSWLEGYGGTVSYQLREAALALPFRPSSYGGGVAGAALAVGSLVARPLLWGFSLALAASDARRPYRGGGHCKNYAIVATKSG